jgi:hypothetical protein
MAAYQIIMALIGGGAIVYAVASLCAKRAYNAGWQAGYKRCLDEEAMVRDLTDDA